MTFEITAEFAGRPAQRVDVRDVSFALTPDAGTITVTEWNGVLRTEVNSSDSWDADLRLAVTVPLEEQPQNAYWPLYEGIIQTNLDPARNTYEFRGPGWNADAHDAERLGMPAVILQDSAGYLLFGADPGFTAHFSWESDRPAVTVTWTYRRQAGAHTGIQRRVFARRVPTIEGALDAWFDLATPEVPAGPEWLHEIAWQHYDYMAKNGDGWFADIDAVCEIVAPEDRHKVAFTLHAWYDSCGRYCYDRETGVLDESWTVFAHIADPRLLAKEGLREAGNQPNGYTFRNLRDHHPLHMDWPEVIRRIRYAKDRGFRVPFYLITGMMDVGSAAEHAEIGDGLESENVPLWIGPDVVAETYLANPLHPDVRERYLGLTRAVLDKVGDLIDALVIDEAYYIGYGQLGPAASPGYADFAQATLFKEIAELCHAHRPDLALLTADHIGTQFLREQAYPYSFYADGIYHDAWNHAQAHEASRFPTWRNTVWSCSWAPASEIENTRWAVLAYDAPISTSNGCFGDDLCIRDMGEAQLATLRDLWEIKRSRSFRQRPQVTTPVTPKVLETVDS